VIQLLIRGDLRQEEDEAFKVVLYDAEWATIEDSVGVVTIVNNDGMPTLTISDCMIVEGDVGTRAVSVPIMLSPPAGLPVTVHLQTVDGTAAAADTDYVAVSDSVTFVSGDTLKYASVSVLGDYRAESNEMLRVVLAPVASAMIGDSSATVTIVNDDLPVMAVTNASVPEGEGGATAALVIVNLSGPVSHDVAVAYQTQDSTATTADGDYVAASGALMFPPGVVADTLMVTMNGDTIFEPDEVFRLVLSNPEGCIITDSVGSITIVNDDEEPTPVDDMPPIREFALLPPWPNPSDGQAVHFEFTLPRPERVCIVVYDVAGREVARLVDGRYAMGRHQAVWNGRKGGRNIASGVYFVRFDSGGKSTVKRMVLVR
jgi:hypothetical protein